MLAVATLITLALAVTAQAQPTVAPGSLDPFIMLVKEIEASSFFPNLDENKRMLTFEMLAAAETRNLALLLDRLGYIILLEYIDALPQDYQHRFVRYSVEHIKDDINYKESQEAAPSA